MVTTPQKPSPLSYTTSESAPIPNELSVESNSGTPTYGVTQAYQTHLPPPPLPAPLLEGGDTPTTQFIEDMGVALTQWTFGLNWRRTIATKQPLINKILRKKQNIDLDLSCILLNSHGEIVERVWFKNVRDNAQSIRYRGDSLDGTAQDDSLVLDSRLDVEKIDIYLQKIPKNVHHLTFVLSSYYGQALSDVVEGYCHISDDEGNVITQLNLPKLSKSCNAWWVATLSREVETWQFTNNLQPLNHHHLAKFEQEIMQFFFKLQHTKIAMTI